MQSLFECPICYESYDLSGKLPKILKVCGHSICCSCLAGILKNRQPRCPLDNLELPDHQNVDEFPVNLFAKEAIEEKKKIIENKAKKERCPEHDKKISYICFNDKEKMCSKCLGSHAKKHHEFIELDDLEGKTNETRQKIKQFTKDMTKFHKDIEKIIDEKRQKYINDIHKNFNEFKSLVNKREQEIISEIDNYFESQKTKIRNLIGKDSELLTDLTEKESKLASIFNHFDLLTDSQVLENINKQIDEWELKISLKEIYNKFWDKLEQNSQDFCDKITLGQNEFFSKTQSIGLGSNEFLISNIFMKPNNQIINGLKIKTFLNIELNNNCLTITTANEQKEILIELNRWNQADTIKLTLNKSLFKEYEALLDHIWQEFQTLKSLDFKFQSGTVSKSLSEILSKGVFTCSSISIGIEGYDVAKHPEVLFLIKEVLHKATNLCNLALNAPKAKFPPQTLKKILNTGFLDGKKMNDFRLDFRETNITDEDIENMFVAMPNLQTFYLNMSATNITDKSLETCGKKTLSTAYKLKSLMICIANLSITDYGVESVLKNYNSLIYFSLYLGSKGITDKTIELISARISNQFINLKKFELDLESTRVSDNCLSQFFRPMSKLEKLGIGLYNTDITDKTINNFVKNTLISIAKPLSQFWFVVSGTNCTDSSISELLKHLNCEKNLLLDFDCKGVTDISITPFIQEKLPAMKKMEKLILHVCNTTVSQEIKNQINALQRRINKS